jgi:hypothetical protein
MRISQFIKNYTVHSTYSFALFGIYALTISPIANNFFKFGQPNTFIAVFGFIMLIAEFFALRFKLGVIRLRTQLKRIAYKKETGKDILPTVTSGVLFGFFARLIMHVSIIMVCMSSLGYDCMGGETSGIGVIAVMTGFTLEMAGIIYMFLNYDFYTDFPKTKKAFREEIQEDDEWAKENLTKQLVKYSYKKELAATIVLQVFSCMLFTSCWNIINQTGIQWVIELHFRHHAGAFACFMAVFPIMVVTVIIGLLPMQISYWVETSLQAFTIKEKKKNWIMFITVGIFACAPTIIKFFEIFLFNSGPTETFPEYGEYLVSLILFIIILVIEIRFFEKKEEAMMDSVQIEKEELLPSPEHIS